MRLCCLRAALLHYFMGIVSCLPGRVAVWLGVVLTGLLALPARAQTTGNQTACTLALAGRVADHEAGTVLPGATVRLLETGEVSATDLYGNYHFHVCQGTYHLEVSFVGYRPETLEVRVATS